MSSPINTKKAIVDVGQLLYHNGMLAGTDGNISVRLDQDRIMVTPSNFAKGRLSPDDMVVVNSVGKLLEGQNRPSSELPMHLFVYKKRPDIAACVHSHPPYATAFAVAGISLVDDILPEAELLLGHIPLTDYAPPGTDAVPKSLEPHIENNTAFLLRNHGLLTIGGTLEEAFNRHEVVEHHARIVYLARLLGNVEVIPSEDFRRLEKRRQKFDEIRGRKS